MKSILRVLQALVALSFLCCGALAQIDLGRLRSLYQDLQASDWGTRQKAFEGIRENGELLNYPETADRFLALLSLEQEWMMRRAAAGLDAEDELYEELLGPAWDLWKDKLTPTSFRIFAAASYNSNSHYAKELGARAGRFVKELLPLATDSNEYLRENATALMGYALAEDQQGTVRLTDQERGALIQKLSDAATDGFVGVRVEVVNALKVAGGPWAIPVLEKMYQRELSFDPSGRNRQIVEAYRGDMKAAMQSIRSRAEMPSQDLGQLQGIYRDLRSSDRDVKLQAFNALSKREDYLTLPETADRLLELLDHETQETRGRPALDMSSDGTGESLYPSLLATTWRLWSERLTPYSFRILAEAAYTSSSAFAKELGARSGPFLPVLPVLSSEPNPTQVRENSLTLLGYVLSDDEAGMFRVPAEQRGWATDVINRMASDADPGVRSAVVKALSVAGGAWAIPVLEQMYEREPSLGASGRSREAVDAFRGDIMSAMQSIQSRSGNASPEVK